MLGGSVNQYLFQCLALRFVERHCIRESQRKLKPIDDERVTSRHCEREYDARYEVCRRAVGHRLNFDEASLYVENLYARVVRQALSFVQRAHEERNVSFGKL